MCDYFYGILVKGKKVASDDELSNLSSFAQETARQDAERTCMLKEVFTTTPITKGAPH